MNKNVDDILNKKTSKENKPSSIKAKFKNSLFGKEESKKKKKNRIIAIVVAILIVVGVGIFIYSINHSLTGAAASVNGTDIPEQKVTDYIQHGREVAGMTDSKAWQQYLETQGITASSLRSRVLDTFVQEEIINQIAKEKNIVVRDEEVQAEYNISRNEYSTQEEWDKYLQSSGLSNDQYKEAIKKYLLSTKVQNQLTGDAELGQEEINKSMLAYADKFNGSKGYYQIMFSSSDENKAAQELARINSGEISFEQAAQDATLHDKLGCNFDYVMYDALIVNPDSVTAAIANMQPGDTSGLIKADQYIYLIKVVDVISCEVPLRTLDKLPEQTQENIKICLKHNMAQELYKKEFNKYKEKYNIKIYEMPVFGIPYAKSIFG